MVLRPLPQSMTCPSLVFPEFVKIWASTSYYLSQQLALHQVGLTSFPSPHILTKVDEVLTDLCHGVQLVCPSFERRSNAPARPCNAQMCNGPPPLSIQMHSKVQAWCHKKGWCFWSPRGQSCMTKLGSLGHFRVYSKCGNHTHTPPPPPIFYLIEPKDVCQLFLGYLSLHE